MKTFLEETLDSILSKHKDVSSLTLIFPSKRAGGFFKQYLKKRIDKTIFSPKIISIEDFIQEISDLEIISPISLLFKCYEAYLNTNSISEKDDFEQFNTWASTLLSDFNEIDRYLIPPKEFFSYLHSIQDINHWYLQDKKTPLLKNYIKFWESLFEFYSYLNKILLHQSLGYQGMVYRKAAESIDEYIKTNSNKKHVFIGFNALNNAEQTIIQKLLNNGNTDIYWDIDKYFLEDETHSSSYFTRKYSATWEYYKDKPFLGVSNNFKKNKSISCVEAQNSISQIKYVGQLLSNLTESQINETTIILADESLLMPLLHSLPLNIKDVNITMGLPIKKFPIVLFFELLIHLHCHASDKIYFKDALSILGHPIVKKLLPNSKEIIDHIIKQNVIYLSFEEIKKINSDDNEIISLLFKPHKKGSDAIIKTCLTLLTHLKDKEDTTTINQIIFYKMHSIFTKIEIENNRFNFIKNISTVQQFFSELIATTTIDYHGDAYKGLQIMGILETRVLDFKNIIITSVNEGVLPSGKTNNSYITYDLKQQFGLPRFLEKDAIYTYHFYRLLQRSQNITLIYSNQSEGLQTGEKSRFISQLEVEKHPNHVLKHLTISPPLFIKKPELICIAKNNEVIMQIKELALKGFSPSALTSYIRNPIQFYYQKILKVKEFDEVEETIAANTLGTIIHDTLEVFYKPLEGSFLSRKVLLLMKENVKNEVSKQFLKTFGGDYLQGKNRVIFEAANRYINNFIDFEIKELISGNTIKILKIEVKLETPLEISELSFPVKIRGIIDRLDIYNNTLRVIDYKTGFVNQGDLEIVDWEDLNEDYKYSKIFQILTYVRMLDPIFFKELNYDSIEAGIISFKNLKNGFLKFAVKPSSRSRDKNTSITNEALQNFTKELKNLILEICNPDINFIEKEI